MRFSPVELDRLSITLLIENSVAPVQGLRGVHGLSMLIRTQSGNESSTVLFDVGADSSVLVGNMKCLGISPESVDCIVLSHNHWDHASGLAQVLKAIGKRTPVVFHPAASRLSYYDRPHLHTTSFLAADFPAIVDADGLLFAVREPFQVAAGLFTAGTVDRVTDEPTGVPTKVLRGDGTWDADEVEDDVPLLALVKGIGLVVLTGCSHAGIVNIIRHAMKLTDRAAVAAVIGGFHLKQASVERIAWTIQELARACPTLVASGHCTGFAAEVALRNSFGDKYHHLTVGSTLTFP